jgi:hypothetical protein
VFGRG